MYVATIAISRFSGWVAGLVDNIVFLDLGCDGTWQENASEC